MKAALWARRLHKWLALVIGLQALAWMAGGLYMTAIAIGTVHGNHLAVRSLHAPLSGAPVVSPEAFAEQFDAVRSLKLKHWSGRDVYEVRHAAGIDLVDAHAGTVLTPLGAEAAIAVARAHYLGQAEVAGVEHLDTPPQEMAGREPPLWRVSFADASRTTLYVSAATGEMVGRRHTLWRWFDFFWMLHIMDYAEREDINNPLLRVASFVGLLFSVGGAWLLWFAFARRART